jgi:hypothetical protein
MAKGKPDPIAKAAPASTPIADAALREALTEALAGPEGEYAAQEAYRVIIANHGEVLPYANIIRAEGRHIEALKSQFQKYGLPVPENTHFGKVAVPESLAEAARQGVASEKANVAMYDRLIDKVKAYPDVVAVFQNLQRASRENHLPAFEAAVQGGGTCQKGRGKGAGRAR